LLIDCQVKLLYSLGKESLIHCSHLCKVVPVLSQELLGVVKLASHKHCQSTPILNASFMLDVEKEEMKWLKY